MRRIPIEYAKSGDILGGTLYSNAGVMLLKEGTVLTDDFLKRIKNYGYLSIYIKDRYSDREYEEIIKPEFMSRIHSSQENLKRLLGNANNNGNKIDVREVNRNISDVNQALEEVLEDILLSKDILDDLVNISIYDDYTLNHSINVMMLSVVMARDIGFNIRDLKKLAMGCIFHDIGKIFIPVEIVNKSGELTQVEYEQIKTHTDKGFNFLNDYTHITVTSSNIARSHHERVDGLGYPRGIMGDEIHRFSKIASVCDVFDALTSDRPYRRAISKLDAMDYVLAEGGTQFDLDMARVFSTSINILPKGIFVHLNDGREGIVCEVNPNFNTRPKIKIIKEDGESVPSYIIDLMDLQNVVVDKILHRLQ